MRVNEPKSNVSNRERPCKICGCPTLPTVFRVVRFVTVRHLRHAARLTYSLVALLPVVHSDGGVSQLKAVETAQYKVQVLDRTCDILDCLAARGPELGVAEITANLGLSKSTVQRLLTALAQHDYVRRAPDTGKYRLSAKLVELGQIAGAPDSLATAGPSYLNQLVAETGETARLGVLRQGQVTWLCAAESFQTLRTPATVGRRTPAHSSSLGKCLLADLDPDELAIALGRHRLVRFTPRTIVTQQILVSELAKVRRQGYALDAEESEHGLKCVGAPVYDQSGRARAALSIAAPAGRMGCDVVNLRIAAVTRVAAAMSEVLGYRGPARTRTSSPDGVSAAGNN